MTQSEVYEFIDRYIKIYDWYLCFRSGNKNITDDTYLYHFIDDLNISITINPNNKGFRFTKIVDNVFTLSSDEFTPLDYKDHFEKNYLRFRNIVLSKNL